MSRWCFFTRRKYWLWLMIAAKKPHLTWHWLIVNKQQSAGKVWMNVTESEFSWHVLFKSRACLCNEIKNILKCHFIMHIMNITFSRDDTLICLYVFKVEINIFLWFDLMKLYRLPRKHQIKITHLVKKISLFYASWAESLFDKVFSQKL